MTGDSAATAAPIVEDSASPTNDACGKKPKPRHRKRGNIKEHANSWATSKQWEFLESRLGLYFDACNMKLWDGFYASTVDAWVEAGFTLTAIGKLAMPVLEPGKETQYNLQLKKRAKDVSLSLCTVATLLTLPYFF